MHTRTYRVYICAGPQCGPKGSLLLVDALSARLEALGLAERVSVTAGGCQNHCESGPTMVVYPGPVFYQEVDSARLDRIAREHFLEGRPVAEFLWGGFRPWQKELRPVQAQNKPSRPTVAPSARTENAKPAKKPKPTKSYDVDDFKW